MTVIVVVNFSSGNLSWRGTWMWGLSVADGGLRLEAWNRWNGNMYEAEDQMR
jgi:hypothetical protein